MVFYTGPTRHYIKLITSSVVLNRFGGRRDRERYQNDIISCLSKLERRGNSIPKYLVIGAMEIVTRQHLRE